VNTARAEETVAEVIAAALVNTGTHNVGYLNRGNQNVGLINSGGNKTGDGFSVGINKAGLRDSDISNRGDLTSGFFNTSAGLAGFFR
jgi:hypothetical protein